MLCARYPRSIRSHCSCVQTRVGSSLIGVGATIASVLPNDALVTAEVPPTGLPVTGLPESGLTGT